MPGWHVSCSRERVPSLLRSLLALSCVALGCGGGASPAPAPQPPDGVVLTTLEMRLDPPVPAGAEAYQCMRFDVGGAKGGAIHALRWTPPTGPVRLHHAMMFATSEPGPTGPVPCDPLPLPVTVLPLYAQGGEATTLAEGVSIALPETAVGFFVQLHLLRFADGTDQASVELLASVTPPEHLAGWVDDLAPVPDILPHTSVTSTAQCQFPGAVHVVGAWPHMHRIGASFHGTVVRANGGREALVDVDPWVFDHQVLYTVDAALAPGDAVETACTWLNPTPDVVEAGPFSSDEMCNQGLVVWPRELAACLR